MSIPYSSPVAGDGWQFGGLGYDIGQVVLVLLLSTLAFNAVRFDRNIGSARQVRVLN